MTIIHQILKTNPKLIIILNFIKKIHTKFIIKEINTLVIKLHLTYFKKNIPVITI